MKQSIYLDTTIPSYYYDERESLKNYIDATHSWWDNESCLYELFTSEYVVAELEKGEYPNQDLILEMMKNIPTLELTPEIVEIAEAYMKEYVMPKGAAGDAFHLACASYHKIDYLLTWNCNHLANANKTKHICIVNTKLGLFTPQLVTPIQLFKESDDDTTD